MAISEEEYRAAFAAHTDGIARIAESADPGLPVVTCPEWTLDDLVRHVGFVHRRVAAFVERGERVPDDQIQDTRPPTGGEAGWLRAGAARALDTIGRAGFDAPAWTFAGPGKVGFWLRRLTHETAVHHADGALSAGREWSVAPDLAADGVSEALQIFCSSRTPRMLAVRSELHGEGQTLHLHATDGGLAQDGEWLVERTPDGPRWSHEHRRADVAVRGPAEVLLLLVMRRVPATDPRLTMFGEAALLEHWLAHTPF